MTLLERLRNEQAAIVGWETAAAWFDDGEIDKEATDAVVALVEAAQRCRAEMFRHREDVWCGDYEETLDALRAALAAFTEDKQGRLPS